MNESVLNRSKAAIQSLSESTVVRLTAEGIDACVSRRCSPYTSHRVVNYNYVDHEPFWYASNRRYQLAIGAIGELNIVPRLGGTHPHHKLRWERHLLPRPLLEPLLQEFTRWIGVRFPQFPPLVSCALPVPELAMFTGGGKPVFCFQSADWIHNECIQGEGWRAYRAGDETPDDWPVIVPPANLPGLAILAGGCPSGNPIQSPHGWYDRPWSLVAVKRPDVDIMSKAGSATNLPLGRWWITVDDTH